MGVGLNFPPEQHLLHVAARQAAHRRVHPGRHDVQLPYQPPGQLPGLPAPDKGPPAVEIAFEQHVVHHAHGGGQSHAQPILGDKAHADAFFYDFAGRFAHDVFLFIEDSAFLDLLQARNGLAQLLLPAACHPGDAQDFALAE